MIEQIYKNKKAILFATGPCLTQEQISFVRENKKDDFVIFGCNDSYRFIDYLDVHYACDTKWWDLWGDNFKESRPDLESWTQCSHSANKFNINHIPGTGGAGLSLDKKLIHFGSNSGYQQLNLSFLMGCQKFYLLGYTMRTLENTHYFGDHPPGLQKRSPYTKFIESFNTIQKEIKPLIHVCSPESSLNRIFQYTPIEEIFND